jgi:hypothetical protein
LPGREELAERDPTVREFDARDRQYGDFEQWYDEGILSTDCSLCRPHAKPVLAQLRQRRQHAVCLAIQSSGSGDSARSANGIAEACGDLALNTQVALDMIRSGSDEAPYE